MDFWKAIILVMMRETLCVLTTFILIGMLFGCSGGDSEIPVKITIKPSSFRVPDGGTVRFSAEVTGTLEKGVSWGVSGPGSIDPETGRYIASVDGQQITATVQATSADDPTAVGGSSVNITRFNKLQGEKLSPGEDELAVGGLFVRGQTVDLNGDDDLDLLTRSLSNGTVTFFGGKGNETFVKKPVSVTDPVAMVVGDFIVQSFLADLAVASGSGQKILFYQVAETTWEIQGPPSVSHEISIAPRNPVSLAVGRFHDSHQVNFPISDLIVGTEEHTIVFFRQDRGVPPFSLTEEVTVPVEGKPIQMIPADFDLDGLLDLVIVREGFNNLLILFGDGDGGFPSSGTVSFSQIVTFLATADFNGDGSLDLVAAHAGANQISVALGLGDGTFGFPLAIALESAPGTLTIGDFNVGQHDDIAIALPDAKALFLLFGDGAGNFIGDWRFSTDALSPKSLISGFFTSFQAPKGFQSVELAYLGINGSSDQFFLLTNQNF